MKNGFICCNKCLHVPKLLISGDTIKEKCFCSDAGENDIPLANYKKEKGDKKKSKFSGMFSKNYDKLDNISKIQQNLMESSFMVGNYKNSELFICKAHNQKYIKYCINCSQNILLDAPKHCEPLASCSGDYHIISLVLAMATGNFDLSKHVLKGYADLLVRNKGQNANDNYSMIHTIWLWDHYMMTGDKELLKQCVKGCEASAKLYLKSIGEQGIIDHPRRYCFIDWLNIDGYNLFSAPACLGQSVMNMFFYKSLACLSDIYKEIGEEKLSKKYASKARKLKKAINNILFDKERGLYFEGQLEVPSGYKTEIPEGNGKIHFRKHANILAVAYGLTTKKLAKAIINKTFGELNELEVQPYFMHYYFEAIHKAGLDNKYARKLLEYWTKNIKIADKALPEGFYKPHPTYPFDYSHAWACSPYYSFIIASSGLNILEPGMKKISLNLSSLRLSNVSYSIGTPYGFIDVKLEKYKRVISSSSHNSNFFLSLSCIFLNSFSPPKCLTDTKCCFPWHSIAIFFEGI